MKKILKILSILFIIIAIFSFASCQENDDLKEKTQLMLDSLIGNDFNEAYNLVSNVTTKEQFQTIFKQMRDYMAGVTEYDLTQIGVSANTQNGITVMRTTYLVTTNAKTYVVESQLRSDIEGLYGFQILESQIEGNGIQCGTITSMKGANLTQWIFLIVGLLEIAFVIVVFIDALRQKIDKKGLWLALILLGTVAITVNSNANGISLNFNAIISLFSSTAFIKYATGASSIRIMIPIAAIVYLIKRKKLINSYIQKNTIVYENAVINENTGLEQNGESTMENVESNEEANQNGEAITENNEENNI